MIFLFIKSVSKQLYRTGGLELSDGVAAMLWASEDFDDVNNKVQTKQGPAS